MYCEFYGLKEKPFTITPNPEFMFLSRSHREAFAHLLYGIDSHAGFIAMTGEVGTGKTTLLRTLLAQLDPARYRSALVFNTCLSGEQLLACICREFDIQPIEKNRFGYLDAINRFLIEQHTAGSTVVLVIDEAQNMEPEVLEQVRMISNMETEQDKLIQIILAGQPELQEVLARHDLRQLNQRITVRCQLVPMGLKDTGDYISHRLKISGCRIPGLFSHGAIKRVYKFSQGVPRLINVACEQALVMAWTQETVSISAAIIGRVVCENRPLSRRGRLYRALFGWMLRGR